MKKLWHVSVEYEFVVVADDKAKATVIARHAVRDVVGNESAEPLVQELRGSLLPEGWDDKCIPYGGVGDQTIGQIKAANG